MAIHTELTPTEAADRLAIRELFDAYAHCADRRDADGQKALFTTDTRFAVYLNGEATDPSYVLEGREALTPVFNDLNQYQTTTHFNGQSTIELDGDRAAGESYTIAHHLFTAGGQRTHHDRLTALPGHLRQDRPAPGTSPNATSSWTGARPGHQPRNRGAADRRPVARATSRPGRSQAAPAGMESQKELNWMRDERDPASQAAGPPGHLVRHNPASAQPLAERVGLGCAATCGSRPARTASSRWHR